MARYLKLLLIVTFLSIVLPVQAQENERVGEIRAEVSSSLSMVPALKSRLENSLAAVARQMLSGKSVKDVSLHGRQYERVLQEVFNRVLFGYEVDKVEIIAGRELTVRMQVTPWGEVVESVEVKLDYGDLPKEVQPLLEKDLLGMRESLRDLFLGLPVDSEDWAVGVAKVELRERGAAQLPEYAFDIELDAGVRSVIKIKPLPAGPLVRDSRISLRSPNIPNLLLLDLKKDLSDEVTAWRNLPVAWIERHHDYFVERLLRRAQQAAITKRYNLRYQLEMQAGSVVEVSLKAETDGYKIWAEGYLDMGSKESETSARLHAGRMLSAKDELFIEADFYPTNFTWRFSGGLGHHFGKDTDFGVQYQASERQHKMWLHQNIAENWQLRLERYPRTSDYELGIRYRVHEFLSVEYLFTRQENWLRLIGVL